MYDQNKLLESPQFGFVKKVKSGKCNRTRNDDSINTKVRIIVKVKLRSVSFLDR